MYSLTFTFLEWQCYKNFRNFFHELSQPGLRYSSFRFKKSESIKKLTKMLFYSMYAEKVYLY